MKTIRQNINIPQPVFEKWIEILVLYKQLNPTIEVSLTITSVNKAVEWFSTYKEDFMKNISTDDLDKIKKQQLSNNEVSSEQLKEVVSSEQSSDINQ